MVYPQDITEKTSLISASAVRAFPSSPAAAVRSSSMGTSVSQMIKSPLSVLPITESTAVPTAIAFPSVITALSFDTVHHASYTTEMGLSLFSQMPFTISELSTFTGSSAVFTEVQVCDEL